MACGEAARLMIDASRLQHLIAELQWLAGELRAESRGQIFDICSEIDTCLKPSNSTEIDADAHLADGWLSERQAAALAGISASGMAKHRHPRGTGPEYRTVDGHPLYRRSTVLAWIAARERHGIVRKPGLDGMERDGGEG